MTGKRRLVYISAEPDRQGHASHTHVHEIVNNLRLLGWEVDLRCPRYAGNGLPGALPRLLAIGRIMLASMFLRRPDAYYIRWHFAAFPVALIARIRRIPLIVEVNGPATDLFIAWPAARRVSGLFLYAMSAQLRWANGIVAVTDGLATMCRRFVGPGKIVSTIPNGADTDRFSPACAEVENVFTKKLPARFFIFFGTMAPWQGIRTVLAALERPEWPAGVSGVFVGDGAERHLVEAAAARAAHIHYLGRIPYDALPAVVARAVGFLVCTEDVEGRGATGLAPLKLFEGIASGVPAIVTDLPFQADLVLDAGCGTVVPPGDPAAIAIAAARIAGDPQARLKMSNSARAAALRHNWRARAEETQNLLLHAVKSRS